MIDKKVVSATAQLVADIVEHHSGFQDDVMQWLIEDRDALKEEVNALRAENAYLRYLVEGFQFVTRAPVPGGTSEFSL